MRTFKSLASAQLVSAKTRKTCIQSAANSSHSRWRHRFDIEATDAGNAASTTPFDYDSAFARNLGWVTRDEQRALRDKCVAIAGLGGVGGAHLLTLARLGVGRFSLAEFDTFELVNFNRQVGAAQSTIGSAKLEVMSAMARDINPEIEISRLSRRRHGRQRRPVPGRRRPLHRRPRLLRIRSA